MLRRVQLALALILTLVLAPLAGARCELACRAGVPHTMAQQVERQPCVRASACCPSNGITLCVASGRDLFSAYLPAGIAAVAQHSLAAALQSAQVLPLSKWRIAGALNGAWQPPGSAAPGGSPLRI